MHNIDEIKEWLEGLTLHNLDPYTPEHADLIRYNRIINYIIRELTDSENGIEAVTQRINQYKREQRGN